MPALAGSKQDGSAEPKPLPALMAGFRMRGGSMLITQRSDRQLRVDAFESRLL
jgi:hypothetical protein